VEKLFISTRDLMDEVSDEKRFTKMVQGALEQIRNGVQDGLFTAHPGEHNWEIAHRVLMPGMDLVSVYEGRVLTGDSFWASFYKRYVR
jgi:cytochrome P450 / NADPH-cytochrome P450 reductase